MNPIESGPEGSRLGPDDLRWRCEPERFAFQTTDELDNCPINIIGQDRAQEALRLGLTMRSEGYNIFVTGDVGSGRSTVVRRMLKALDRGEEAPSDIVYVHNFVDTDQPRLVVLPAGRGRRLKQAMQEVLESLARDVPSLFDSGEYRKHRTAIVESATREQKGRLKEFEKRIQQEGFAVVQVQMGPLTRPQVVPVVAGNPVDIDQLENLVEQGQFKQEDYEQLLGRRTELAGEMEAMGKSLRNADRTLRRKLGEIDRELARPLVAEAVAEIGESFAAEGLEIYLAEVVEDILDHLATWRDVHETPPGEEGEGAQGGEATVDWRRYGINVLVDNAGTRGRPIIWETAPSYRNLFGAINRVRTQSGDWETDHLRIKAGSLLRANGGILVLDAMDVLVEPGVWAALKRTLRNRSLEIQSFDPLQVMSGESLKPQSVPIDLKVVMIGTRQIYRMLFFLDEDFKKIFKVKSEFAMHTPRSDEEIHNYACFVHKKVNDDSLPPFGRGAVAAVVEHGVRMVGDREKLTTRFVEIADLIREAGYWCRREGAEHVAEEHVGRALDERVRRVSMFEEALREGIAEGTVLLDLKGRRVGQVNGLAVLDQGDHTFAQPSRITATTSVGRHGIIDIDRESSLSGSIHTKGVLILTGFLRERFAQTKPLALTASLCFEQNYGGVDGDSASSAELYALLSSLSDVPLDQGISVTGSVNQKGEIQPVGGVNRKIEGFFDLCREVGLTGEQGVMIPRRNVRHLMLRKDVVEQVAQGRFHVWAVSSIEEGLSVLTEQRAGERGPDGNYPPESIYGRVDAQLTRLAEEVREFVRGSGAV